MSRSIYEIINGVRLRAYGVTGSGANSDFLRRSLDIYFGKREWHFVTSPWTKWYRRRRKHLYDVGDGATIRKQKALAAIAARYSWLAGTLEEALRNCGRRSLAGAASTSEWRHDQLETARAGYVLARAGKRVEMTATLRRVAGYVQPVALDPRVWERLGV